MNQEIKQNEAQISELSRKAIELRQKLELRIASDKRMRMQDIGQVFKNHKKQIKKVGGKHQHATGSNDMPRQSADIYRAGGDNEDDIMSEMSTRRGQDDESMNEEIEVLEDESEHTEEEDGYSANGDENLIEASMRDSKPQIGVVSHFSNNMLIKERNAGKVNEVDRQVDNFLKRIVHQVEFDQEHGCVILVRFGTNIMQSRFSEYTKTFGLLASRAAQYFNLPENMVFLADKAQNGCIFMKDMLVKDELFPLGNAMPIGYQPELFLILQKNMSQ